MLLLGNYYLWSNVTAKKNRFIKSNYSKYQLCKDLSFLSWSGRHRWQLSRGNIKTKITIKWVFQLDWICTCLKLKTMKPHTIICPSLAQLLFTGSQLFEVLQYIASIFLFAVDVANISDQVSISKTPY